jgi:hypothetical protein
MNSSDGWFPSLSVVLQRHHYRITPVTTADDGGLHVVIHVVQHIFEPASCFGKRHNLAYFLLYKLRYKYIGKVNLSINVLYLPRHQQRRQQHQRAGNHQR